MKLLSELGEAPFRFGFFNAVRLLECAHSDRARLGQAMRAADEPARLGQEPSLAFAPASLASFKPGRHASPPWLNVHFLGLLGPNGPLPLHLTEYARDRSRHHRDPTFGRFLNIFNNRLLALFYRAWANGEPTVSLDRPDSDRFAVYVGALCGFGIPALRERDALPDRARFYYCGRISNQARNPEGLAAVVGDYFDMPAQVLEFVGDWLAVPQDCRWRLGTQGAGGRLGVRTTLGERTWDCQHKFRLQLGRLRFADYRRFLPGTRSLRRLQALVRSYVGDELDWDLGLWLRADEVPAWRLDGATQLGWSTWLARRPDHGDALDAVLRP